MSAIDTISHEWIMKCFREELAKAKLREEKRLDKIRKEPNGRRVKIKGSAAYKYVPHPEPKPIGVSPKKIFGPEKKRPAPLYRLEAELTRMRKAGELKFTSKVWWE